MAESYALRGRRNRLLHPLIILAKKEHETATDEELVSNVKAGNSDDFALLIKRYSGAVYRLVYRVVGNQRDAEDITQETFLKAYKGLTTFKPQLPFKPWLFKIALNEAISFLRNKRTTVELTADLGSTSALPLESKCEENQDLAQALLSLPLRYRQVLLLRGMEDFSFQEIAQILDVNEATARSWFSRAKKQLLQLLQTS